MGFETSGIMNHVIDANGIINTTFLFSCLGYVFLYFLIYLQKLFFKWNQRYEGENYKRRKKSPGETSGRKCFELEDNFTAWQLDRFSVKCPVMASFDVWFAWKLLGGYLCWGCVCSLFTRGKSKKEKKKKARATVRQYYIYFGLFQTCADFKSIRIYRFCALDRVNISPSANVPGNL